jgi:hypothetical protein
MGSATQASGKVPATRFVPTGKRTVIAKLVEQPGLTSEQKKILYQACEDSLTDYETAAKKAGHPNDMAGALAYYVVVNWILYRDANVPSDVVINKIVRKFQQDFDRPFMRQAPDADKESAYQWCIGTATITLALASAGRGDPVLTLGMRSSAGNALTSILQVEPDRVSITANGLAIAPKVDDAVGGIGNKASTKFLSFRTPAGWKERRSLSIIDLLASADAFPGCRLFILPPRPVQGRLEDAFLPAWREFVILLGAGTDKKKDPSSPILVRPLPGGGACAYAMHQSIGPNPDWMYRKLAGICIRVYLVNYGDQVVPVCALSGPKDTANKYQNAVEQLLSSIRIGDREPQPARAIRTEDVIGTWSQAGKVIDNRVTVPGIVYTFKPDGAYTQSAIATGTASRPQDSEAGTWSVEGNILVLKSAHGDTRRFRIVGINPPLAGTGNKPSLVLMTADKPFPPAESATTYTSGAVFQRLTKAK